MVGLVRAEVIGYENVEYKRKSDGALVAGRRLYCSYPLQGSGCSGDWACQVFSNDPQALGLKIGDSVTLFRDDYSKAVPVRFVPASF